MIVRESLSFELDRLLTLGYVLASFVETNTPRTLLVADTVAAIHGKQ